MIISSLKKMEFIVKNNKSLIWDGWNVVELKRKEYARTSKDGVYINGSWFIRTIYKPDRQGWHLPNKFGG